MVSCLECGCSVFVGDGFFGVYIGVVKFEVGMCIVRRENIVRVFFVVLGFISIVSVS